MLYNMNENFILDQKLKSIIITNVKMCTFSKLIKIIKNKIKKCIFSKVDWKIKEIKYSI